MVKYRLLAGEELAELEKEFVEFLILNGIVANDWTKMKDENPEKATRMIELFSDVVFEKIMRQTQFLEYRGAQELKVLQCLKDKFVLIGLDATKVGNANLLDNTYLNRAVQQPPETLKVYTTDIPYNLSREEEIFGMTEAGYQISDGKLFKTLCLVLPM